ncbi:MAG TPA: HAMP domain-containing sensor histidine kinase [Prolixibacteraceae bacterium]|nr:HAMP domain-containing sensor histidine kinase [Prolixibacteraceae bacterium]
MDKRIFTVLIALMGISILGIVIVQLVWMNNAIRVKNELFDRSVNEALTSTTSRLETIQELRMINHYSFGDSGRFRGFEPVPPPPPIPDTTGTHPRRIVIPRVPGNPSAQQIERMIKAVRGRQQSNYRITTQSDSIRGIQHDVIIINTDSVLKNLDSAYAVGLDKFDSIARQFDHQKDSNQQLRKRFDFKTRRLKRTATRVVEEISQWEQHEPSPEVISGILKKELQNRNIPIPFEFGIIRDSVISNKTEKADSLMLEKSNYRVNLYPNDIIQRNIHLAVYFPEKGSFIYKTLNWLLIISLLFSVIVLVTFAFSIYFILKQKKISEMKSDFINNMTHEFKTPLATISVAADSVMNQKVIENPERIRYFVDMIKKENIRMNQQVEDILTIARLDKKEFEFKWQAVNLHEVIEDAIQSIVLQVEKKGGSIKSELEAPNPVATSDPVHFANMIYNLLDNANKYSPHEPEIRISTRNSAKGVIISVEDKGIGMTKSVQSRIFERFYRQTSGNIHNVKGFGLGLSYVKAVLEANRGSISVHSEPGKGSRFEVFVPFARE